MSVILAEFNDPVQATKLRDIAVSKEQVFKEVDLITHKHIDGSERQDLRVRNAVSSDFSEDVDGAVIARYVEFRDAMLRRKVAFALKDLYQEKATDRMTLDDGHYHYHFSVPDEFNDNLLRPLAEYIHRFLVFGALFDWYSQFEGSSREAAMYGSQVEGLEDDIASMLRGSSVVKRHLQPFGPAYRFKEDDRRGVRAAGMGAPCTMPMPPAPPVDQTDRAMTDEEIESIIKRVFQL